MNIFVDCGFYAGNALKIYMDEGIVDETWTVYAFDPSTVIDVKEQTKRFPMKIKLYKRAVWIYDGKIAFWNSERNNASFVEGTAHNAPLKRRIVQCIDFSEFLCNLPKADNIICSMDIEGSEYPVLEKLIAMGTIDRINTLDIEFHHRLLADYTQDDSQDLIDEITSRGVQVKLKVPLN